MGSNYKSNGGKCGCCKRVKKVQRVPQRGPGVAELEKILSDKKQENVKPLYTPNGSSLFNQPHFHMLRSAQNQPVMLPLPLLPLPWSESHIQHSHNFCGTGNVYVKPWRSDGTTESDQISSSNESGMSFTQMMTVGDPQEPKNNMMNNSYPSMGLNPLSRYCPSERFYNKCRPVSPEEDENAMKNAGWKMPSPPHPFYGQQLSQTSIENGRSKAEHERFMLRNILTLGPPSPTEEPSAQRLNPIFIESDTSEEQCKDKNPEDTSDKTHQSQILSSNLLKKSLSLDDTKLSLHHNAAQAEELSLDLTLKL